MDLRQRLGRGIALGGLAALALAPNSVVEPNKKEKAQVSYEVPCENVIENGEGLYNPETDSFDYDLGFVKTHHMTGSTSDECGPTYFYITNRFCPGEKFEHVRNRKEERGKEEYVSDWQGNEIVVAVTEKGVSYRFYDADRNKTEISKEKIDADKSLIPESHKHLYNSLILPKDKEHLQNIINMRKKVGYDY